MVLVFVRPAVFDPLHPDSGRRAIERLYPPFDRECPGEVGRTLKVFFQDELDFGGRMHDPKIDDPRSFQGLKVNSSISHLYQRPRVWVEAFHSSGWGTTPAEVVGAINEDFVCGANVVNPHGLYLFDRTCDFDFIDFESLDRAEMADGELRVSGEAYRVLILPAMAAARDSTLQAARDFVRVGGLVIACGRLPLATERGDRDAQLVKLLEEVFNPQPHPSDGRGVLVSRAYAEVLCLINQRVPRDVVSNAAPLQGLHRRLENADVFYRFNPSSAALTADVKLRAVGTAEQWNVWTGAVQLLPIRDAADRTTELRQSFAVREAKIFFIWAVPPGLQGHAMPLFWYLVAMNLLVRTGLTMFFIPEHRLQRRPGRIVFSLGWCRWARRRPSGPGFQIVRLPPARHGAHHRLPRRLRVRRPRQSAFRNPGDE